VLVGHWTGGLDRARLDRVLAGEEPFDEATMLDAEDLEDPITPPVPVTQTPALQPA